MDTVNQAEQEDRVGELNFEGQVLMRKLADVMSELLRLEARTQTGHQARYVLQQRLIFLARRHEPAGDPLEDYEPVGDSLED